jgi:hypothetical protein
LKTSPVIGIFFTFKQEMTFIFRSAYVDILRNKTEGSILCKIRLSAHNLAIERGRHLGLHTRTIALRYIRKS